MLHPKNESPEVSAVLLRILPLAEAFIASIKKDQELSADSSIAESVIETAAAVSGMGNPAAERIKPPKTFEEMTPEEIADLVRQGRELEMRTRGKSDPSSSIA